VKAEVSEPNGSTHSLNFIFCQFSFVMHAVLTRLHGATEWRKLCDNYGLSSIYSICLPCLFERCDILDWCVFCLFQEQVEALRQFAPNVEPAQISQLVSCCYSLLSPESSSLGLPDFPADSLPAAVKLMVCDVNIMFVITVKHLIYYNSKLWNIYFSTTASFEESPCTDLWWIHFGSSV
jgi:hypothetical protein